MEATFRENPKTIANPSCNDYYMHYIRSRKWMPLLKEILKTIDNPNCNGYYIWVKMT